jgi:hypothetical protein
VILNFNSRSICNKNVNLKQIVDDNKADIIIITESWINSINESIQLNMIKKDNPEYEIIWQKRTREDVSRGGGIIIMVKKSYSKRVKKLKTQQQPSTDNKQLLESIILRIDPHRITRGKCICTLLIIAGDFYYYLSYCKSNI